MVFLYYFQDRFNAFPKIENSKKIKMLQTTIVAPVGVSRRMERQRPKIAHITETMAELITTALKLLYNRMEESAGKIISAVISREPTNQNTVTEYTQRRMTG